jgi:site-specific recombinase XerD
VSGSELRAVGTAAAAAREAGPQPGWMDWLRARLDPGWRAGEWDERLDLFTGDLCSDQTAAWACRTPGCAGVTRYHHRRCNNCRRARSGLDVDWDAFDAAPPRHRIRPDDRGACAVPGCQGERHCAGLCFRHERSWRKNPAEPVASFATRARPLARGADCRVAGCGRETISRRGLCRFHDHRLHRRHDVASLGADQLTAWIAAEHPLLKTHQFSLAALPGPLRVEMRYALQCRDACPPPLDPGAVRILVRRLSGTGKTSLLDADAVEVCECGGRQYDGMIRGLFRDLRRHLQKAQAIYEGVDPFAGDIWQVALLDLQTNASRRWPAVRGVIDLRVVELAWLREIVKDWAKSTRPYVQRLRETLRACQTASQTLVAAGRTDPTLLGAGDYTRIVEAIAGGRRQDGAAYSASHRNLMLYQFREVIGHGRAVGLMSMVPDPFRPAGRHRVHDEPNEDELGKALPEKVIAQLDANVHLLGPSGRAGSLSATDLQLMHQAVYQILRDTGRRPGEVVSLRPGCVEMIDGAHNLIYDNHKAGRMRRRLPITAETAETILSWQRHRVGLLTPPAQRGWLFPSPLLRAQQSHGHLTSAAVARVFKEWTAKIGTLDSELLGPGGSPAPFDRALVIPYALRHSYAQRHADAGVPVDVLKELMDHTAVATTMGYYRVGLKRKQRAIRSVGALAVDVHGDPAPFTSPTAYQRASVSVPYGNCTEPSNVKAGGGACPIRFQCAGCGFYRPDPSYLPALESHIAGLRADRETARAIDAADYVTANLTAEIDAFTAVAEQMRRRLAELGPDERAEVEQASRLLRRARAARQLPVIDATTTSSETAG